MGQKAAPTLFDRRGEDHCDSVESQTAQLRAKRPWEGGMRPKKEHAWVEYIAERKVSVAVNPGNTTAHKANMPDLCKLTRELQEFVREHRLWQEITVAKDVALFLCRNGYLDYNTECSVSVASALQYVQRFLSEKRLSPRKEEL